MDAEDYRNTVEVILRTGYLALSRQELDEAPYPYESKATLGGVVRFLANTPIAAVPAKWDDHLGLWPMTTTNTSNTIRLIAVADIHNLVLSERLNWHRTSEEALA